MSNFTTFTIEEVERFSGESFKKSGADYQGPCIYCRQEGGDTHGDNMHFNPKKGFFCGACINNEHGKRLAQEIIKARTKNKKLNKQIRKTKYDTNNIEKYSSNLLKNKEMLELVKENVGLSDDTIKECKIGYDKENNVFLLPMIALDGSITGFEIRVPENNKGKFKFLSKTKGFADNPEKCLSKINNPTNAKNAIICAGYKDGYAIYQHLKDIGEENNWQILTNSNGEGNTAKALKPHIKYLEIFE